MPDHYGKTVMKLLLAYAAENPFRFSTKWFDDENGLGYWGYRYYIPEQGRWLNRDPIGESGGINIYAYVQNGVINRYDRHGLQPYSYNPYLLNNPNDYHPSGRPPSYNNHVGLGRLLAAFHHYMYGDGSPWYVDSWAKDVQATPGYELVVGNLMSEIRKQACRLKSVSPCGVPTKYTVKQSDPLLTAYLNLRIAR
jgi:RHS repeat-associated protein